MKKKVKQRENIYIKHAIYESKNWDWIILINFMEVYAQNVEIIIIHLGQ